MSKTIYYWLTVVLVFISASHAAELDFDSNDFTTNPAFSVVNDFDFFVDLTGPIIAGGSYINPGLDAANYFVFGNLASTPSGFSSFTLARNVPGNSFYAQGSSLSFSVSATADLSDGLQVSELSGPDPVFVFNGREVETGRYHPALLELNADGTGRIQNSNNFGATVTNPVSGMTVNVDFGDEYITDLTFDPATLTIASVVPEPKIAWWLAVVLLGLFTSRTKAHGQ